jgi:hypothetical protein
MYDVLCLCPSNFLRGLVSGAYLIYYGLKCSNGNGKFVGRIDLKICKETVPQDYAYNYCMCVFLPFRAGSPPSTSSTDLNSAADRSSGKLSYFSSLFQLRVVFYRSKGYFL